MDKYMSEIKRLFQRPSENDAYNIWYPSPLSGANRSSSSADSTSPESFPELLFFPERNLRPSGSEHETPKSHFAEPNFLGRRQRPIVGRKILPTAETPIYDKPLSAEQETKIWTNNEFYQSSPPVHNYYIENKYRQNASYELFPSDNRGFDFPQFLTPVKQPQNSSPNYGPVYKESPKTSPNYNMSPSQYHSQYPQNNMVNQGPRFNSPSRCVPRFQSPDLRQKMCTFCRKNGETPVVYMTHSVKQKVDNKYVVTCPILRSYVCSTCGVSGDDAHTITYCPVLRSSNNGQPLESTTIALKNTRVKSNGRRRY